MNPSRLSATTRGLAGVASLALLAGVLAGCGGGDSSSAGSDASSTPSTSTSTSASPSASPSASRSASPSDTASGGAGGSASDSAGGTSSSAAPSPASTAQGADFTALSGQEISDSAKADMLGLQAVHYAGSVDASSDAITLDVHAKADGDCSGTVGISGGTATVLAVGGTSWFKGDRKFWKAAAGASAGKIIKAIGDKWVVDTNHDFAQFCSLNQFLTNLFASSGTSTYTPQGTSQVGGQQVVAVGRASTDGTSPSTGYVLTSGKHYLVRIERSAGGKQGQLDFSDFDQDFTVKAPAADNTVDPSTLG